MTKTNYCSYCMGSGKMPVAHDLLLRSPEAQRKYMEHVEISARTCTHCNGTGSILVTEENTLMENSLVKDVSRAFFNAQERYYWKAKYYGDVLNDEPGIVHDTLIEKIVFEGTIGECIDFINEKVAETVIKLILTREHTPDMLKAGRDVVVTKVNEFNNVPDFISAIYTAMNKELLKEIKND